jgi:hypothetical protein
MIMNPSAVKIVPAKNTAAWSISIILPLSFLLVLENVVQSHNDWHRTNLLLRKNLL